MSFFNLRAVLLGDAGVDDRGLLVCVNGRLIAVLAKLSAESHENARGGWFIEASFGRWCGVEPEPFGRLALALGFIAQRFGYDSPLLEAELSQAQKEFDDRQ